MAIIDLIRSGLMIPDYWHPWLEIQPGFATGRISLYPLSMAAKADWAGPTQAGVPLVKQLSGEGRVFPVAVALYGLGSYDAWHLTQESRYEQQMWTAVRWLDEHAVPLGGGIGWRHDKPVPEFGLKAPWFSGIVQGFALSLFVRAHAIQPDQQRADAVRRTWLAFKCSTSEGGFTRFVREGVVYEEYPTAQLDCVFNGSCHALIGLWEAATSGLVREAEHDFRIGINGLQARLHRFDHHGWSLYSLNECLEKPFLASPYYHRANGLLAQIIGQIAAAPEFCTFGSRWLATSQSLQRRVRASFRIFVDRAAYVRRLRAREKSQAIPTRSTNT